MTTFRHHSFRFMMISRKFSRCFDREALSVYPQADRSGAAIKAEAPSTITSVAMSPFRWTEDAPCGIFWPGSVTYWIDKGTGVDPSKVNIEIPLPQMPPPLDFPAPKTQ